MYDNFNKQYLGERIHALRNKRWEQYKSSEDEKSNPYEKYAFCRTQGTLAKKLGVERRAVQGWESGSNSPSVKHLVELSNIMDCNIDYFLGANENTEIAPIALASHYSGISAEIIKYGIEHPDYLDCLNFFMLPENCKSLFNDITISAWRKYWIDSCISTIKSPFKEEVIKAYDEYSAITPIHEINQEGYTKFLKEKFPEKKYTLKAEKSKNGYSIRGCFNPIDYMKFFYDKKLDYPKFIKYLSDNTYTQLSNNALIETQKLKLAKVFIDLFTRYLSEK